MTYKFLDSYPSLHCLSFFYWFEFILYNLLHFCYWNTFPLSVPLLGYGSTHVLSCWRLYLKLLICWICLFRFLSYCLPLILRCDILFGLMGHFGLLKDIKLFLSLSWFVSTLIFQSDIAILLQREMLHLEHSGVLKPCWDIHFLIAYKFGQKCRCFMQFEFSFVSIS